MKLRNILFLSVVVANLTACAQVVTKNYEGQRGGTVKYTNEIFFAQKNRSKAIQLANEYCAPSRARITAENNMSEFTGNTTSNTTNYGRYSNTQSTQSKQEAIYIHFKCGSKRRA